MSNHASNTAPALSPLEQDRTKPLESHEISGDPHSSCTCCQDKRWVERGFCDKANRSRDPRDPCAPCRFYGGSKDCVLSKVSDKDAMLMQAQFRVDNPTTGMSLNGDQSPLPDPKPMKRFDYKKSKKGQTFLVDGRKDDSLIDPNWHGNEPPALRPFSASLKRGDRCALMAEEASEAFDSAISDPAPQQAASLPQPDVSLRVYSKPVPPAFQIPDIVLPAGAEIEVTSSGYKIRNATDQPMLLQSHMHSDLHWHLHS